MKMIGYILVGMVDLVWVGVYYDVLLGMIGGECFME